MSVVAAEEMDPIQRIAGTDDETVVRRRFGSHNARYASFLFGAATVICTMLSLAYAVRGTRLLPKLAQSLPMAILAGVAFALCVHSVRSERRNEAETRLLRHFNDWLLVLLVSQLVAILFFISRSREAPIVWVIVFAGILLILRLPFDRRLMAHLVMIMIAVLMCEIGLFRVRRGPFYGGMMVNHVVALLIGGYTSRRARQGIIGDWSERRAQAQEQLRMRGELQFAREVQLSMLPEKAPSLEWLDIGGISVPASEVGGDYFDYFPLGVDRLAIVSGDVAGHGLASGIVLSALRAGFALLRADLSNPGLVLRRLHDVVAQASRRRMLTTATIILFNRTTSTATIANAGHPPIILRHKDGTVVSIDLFAPPLGVRLPIHVAERKLPFASGDTFVLHSDGVYESRNSAGESYGLEALEALIAGLDPAATAEEIRDAILSDVERFRDGTPQEDDITLVIARVR